MKSISKLFLCLAVAAGLMISGCGQSEDTPKEDKKDEKTSAINDGNLNASTDPSDEAGEMTLVSLKLPAMT